MFREEYIAWILSVSLLLSVEAEVMRWKNTFRLFWMVCVDLPFDGGEVLRIPSNHSV